MKYTAGIVDKTGDELKAIDRKTGILSECSKLALTAYKKRHDKVATRVHLELGNKDGF